MAVLALTCVKRSTYRENIKCHKKDLKRIKYNIASLVKKILREKKANGLIGNIYSTGEAMQVSQRIEQESEKGIVEENSIFILIHAVSYTNFDFTHVISLTCLKCVLHNFNLYLSIINASVKLFLATTSLRNSGIYYNLSCSTTAILHFTIYHCFMFSFCLPC